MFIYFTAAIQKLTPFVNKLGRKSNVLKQLLCGERGNYLRCTEITIVYTDFARPI